MSKLPKPKTIFDDIKVNAKITLAGLWASTMFCYIYNDLFSLMRPGALRVLLTGKGPLGPISQEFLLAATISVAIPSVMVILSLVLRPAINRWLNIIIGTLYTIMIAALATAPGAWIFYIFMSAVEVTLTMAIVWTALAWPRREASERAP